MIFALKVQVYPIITIPIIKARKQKGAVAKVLT